jgi:hypothetical protein
MLDTIDNLAHFSKFYHLFYHLSLFLIVKKKKSTKALLAFWFRQIKVQNTHYQLRVQLPFINTIFDCNPIFLLKRKKKKE